MAENQATDAELVARCLQRDASGWAELVQRYQRLVYAVARNGGLDSQTMADVFQTVFARLVEQLPRLRQADRLQAWIVTTAKRETVAQGARQRRQQSLSSDDGSEAAANELPDPAPIAEQVLDELQQQHRLRLALDRLDARCRELLLLVFRDDDDALPYDEVARRLAIPVGSVGPTRARCLGKLRTLVR